MDEEQKKTETEHHTEEEHHAPEHHEHHGAEHHEHHMHHEHHEHGHHAPEHHVHRKTSILRIWQVIAALFAVLFVAAIFTHGFSGTSGGQSKEVVADRIIKYVNDNLLAAGTTAKLNSVKEENGMYSINMSIGAQSFAAYASKNGELFFPQVFDTTVAVPKANTQTQQQPTSVPENDKPVVELFVMSHCPYGTQAEKGILPAVEKLGSKIDFQLKFVYYAMHGEKEVKEQMNQVCIMNEQKAKFFPYLKCFLNSTDGSEAAGAACMKSAGIDRDALAECLTALDEEFGIMASFADQSKWMNGRFPLFDVHKAENTKYGVGGSPTLIINGAEASPASRSPASYLASICAAFNTPPAECSSTLSSTGFSAGFGYSTSDSAALAQCG